MQRDAGRKVWVYDQILGHIWVNDSKNPDETRMRERFSEIARELSELAEAASKLVNASNPDGSPNAADKAVSKLYSPKALLRAAQLAYQLRRSRSKIFKDDSLFGEPAWDILLDLYIADLKGLQLSITDACIGSAVPTTTALRWITILQQSDLLARKGDPRDARRAYLSLTDRGYSLMQNYFEQALDQSEQ